MLADLKHKLEAAGNKPIVISDDDKTRIFGLRELVKSDLFEHPYCRPNFYFEDYYLSLQELYNKYPYFKDKPIYDYDNNLHPWDGKEKN